MKNSIGIIVEDVFEMVGLFAVFIFEMVVLVAFIISLVLSIPITLLQSLIPRKKGYISYENYPRPIPRNSSTSGY